MSTDQVAQALTTKCPPGSANITVVKGTGNLEYMIPGVAKNVPLMVYLIFPGSSSGAQVGHFVATIQRGPNEYDFFDPYGGEESVPYIVPGVLPIGTHLNINHHHFERRAVSVNTCGEWCVLRLESAHLNNYRFAKAYENISDHSAANKVFRQIHLDPTMLEGGAAPDEEQKPSEGPVVSQTQGGDPGANDPLLNAHTGRVSQYLGALPTA